MNGPYRILGFGLALVGAVFAPIAYFIIGAVSLTSVGITAIMLGVIVIALANSRPHVSPEASQLILKTGMENTASLLEELGLTTPAVYLPSSTRNGRPQTLIPLAEVEDFSRIEKNIPGRLIVRYSDAPDGVAIAVTTPGSMVVDLLEAGLGPTPAEIEAAATHLLVGLLDIATSITISRDDGLLEASIRGARLHHEDIWYYRCLGSPLASILATISSEALEKPVRIKEESYSKGTARITLEVLP